MTVNHWVPGSSPGRGAIYDKAQSDLGLFVWGLKWSWVAVGSVPAAPILLQANQILPET
jgi:hypothetical protein